MTSLKLSNRVRAVVILCSLASFGLKVNAQVDAQLQTLDSHIAGVWVGTNHDYTKTPMITTALRLEIADNPKKSELRLVYTYGIKGQKGYDHSVRFMSIKPATSLIELHWQHEIVGRYKANGLTEVLNAGYGKFTFGGTINTVGTDRIYVCIFHLEPNSLIYLWEKSDDGVTFYKTGDWTLNRESPTAIR